MEQPRDLQRAVSRVRPKRYHAIHRWNQNDCCVLFVENLEYTIDCIPQNKQRGNRKRWSGGDFPGLRRNVGILDHVVFSWRSQATSQSLASVSVDNNKISIHSACFVDSQPVCVEGLCDEVAASVV